MGQEIACLAHIDGKSARGTALLETTEILFRGEVRLKIPFAAIKEVKASNGELRMNSAEGIVVLELGDKAEQVAR